MLKKSLIPIVFIVLMLLLTQSLLQKTNQSIGIKVLFTPSDQYIPNPYMGAVCSTKSTERSEEGTLVYAEVSWRQLEPTKADYDFESFETLINYEYFTQSDHMIILRFNMDWPDQDIGKDLPDWLFDEMVEAAVMKYTLLLENAEDKQNTEEIKQYKDALYVVAHEEELYQSFIENREKQLNIPSVGTYYQYAITTDQGVTYHGGFSPNYSSETLMGEHSKILKALGERYNDKSKVFMILIGSLGHWGEMHTTYVGDVQAAGSYPLKVVENEYLSEYVENFPDVIVCTRYPRALNPEKAYGLYHHGLGSKKQTYDWFKDYYEQGYTDYLTKEKYPAMPDFWKYAPCGGEFIYTGEEKYIKDAYIETTLQQVKDIHMTYIYVTENTQNDEEENNIQRILSTIGYRFVLKEAVYPAKVSRDEPFMLTTHWTNEGVAPFYFPWHIKALLVDQNGKVKATQIIEKDLRNLQPQVLKTYETKILLPSHLEKGVYTLYIGIFNPDTNEAEIKLAIEEKDHNKLYKIGDMNILESERE